LRTRKVHNYINDAVAVIIEVRQKMYYCRHAEWYLTVSIIIRVNSNRIRRWHMDLQKSLRVKTGHDACFVFEGEADYPRSLELLLSLEKLIYRTIGPSSIDTVPPPSGTHETSEHDPERIINLTQDYNEIPAWPNMLTPVFDGTAGEDALLGALLEGRVPVLEILAGPSREVVGRVVLALDEVHSVRERFESVVAQLCRLLIKVLSAPQRTIPPIDRHSPSSRPTLPSASRYSARLVSSSAVRRAYQLCLFSPHWRVGWRFVDDGGVWKSHTLAGAPWNDIADPGFRFYADPFPYTFGGKTFVFVEEFDHRDGKGAISAIPFDERGQIGPAKSVLSEPWHLSYPFLFEYRGEVWMIPESSEDKKISLYRADPFPSQWTFEVDIIDDTDAHDASLLQFAGKLWIFATVRDELGGAMDSLSIFFADELFGPWSAHPRNPVLIDAGGARQAGQFHQCEGKLWRPVQDCRGGYGRALGLAEVTTLDEHDFNQVVHTVLRPDVSWPGRRLHTLNRFGRLECIDGSRNSFRFRAEKR
jgi:hypothetical protein